MRRARSQISEEGKLTEEDKHRIQRWEQVVLSRDEENEVMKAVNIELKSDVARVNLEATENAERPSRVEKEIMRLKRDMEKLIS